MGHLNLWESYHSQRYDKTHLKFTIMKTLELTRVGEHRMEGGLYKDKDGKYYVDCHSEIESGKF